MLVQLKEILKKEGGKCILLDDDGCHYLVIELRSCEQPKEEERQTVTSDPTGGEKESVEDLEKVNRDLDALRVSEIKNDEPIDLPENSQEVKIEDLPF